MDIQKSLLSDAEANIARKTKDLETNRTILSALPANLPFAVKLVSATAHKALGTVFFNVGSRQDILTLLGVLPPVPLILLRDGFVTFLPRAAFDGQPKPSQQVTDIEPFLFQLNASTKYASAHAEWWTELPCGLVKVRAELPRNDYAVKLVESGPKDHKWEFSGVPSAECIHWWGSDKNTPPTLTLYWDGIYGGSAKASLLESHTMRFKVK